MADKVKRLTEALISEFNLFKKKPKEPDYSVEGVQANLRQALIKKYGGEQNVPNSSRASAGMKPIYIEDTPEYLSQAAETEIYAPTSLGREEKNKMTKELTAKELEKKGQMKKFNEAEEPVVYGIPDSNKYPLDNPQRLIFAIRIFNTIRDDLQEEFAEGIIKQAEKFGIDLSIVPETSALFKYLPRAEKAASSESNVHLTVSQPEKVEEPIAESYTLEELNEAFAQAGYDTKKYTVEYLAEQLGFKQSLNESSQRVYIYEGPVLDSLRKGWDKFGKPIIKKAVLPLSIATSLLGFGQNMNVTDKVIPQMTRDAESSAVQQVDDRVAQALQWDEDKRASNAMKRYEQHKDEFGRVRIPNRDGTSFTDYTPEYEELSALFNSKQPGQWVVDAFPKGDVGHLNANVKFKNVSVDDLKPGADNNLDASLPYNPYLNDNDEAKYGAYHFTDEEYEQLFDRTRDTLVNSDEIKAAKKSAQDSLELGVGSAAVAGTSTAGLAADKIINKKKEKETEATNESYTAEELHEAFAQAGYDTKKYTVEYLAEQLGFRPVNEGFKEFAGSVGKGVKSGLKRLDNSSNYANKAIEGSGATGFGSMVGKGMVGIAKAATTPLAVGFGAVKGGIDHFKKNKGESKPKDTGSSVSESYVLNYGSGRR